MDFTEFKPDPSNIIACSEGPTTQSINLIPLTLVTLSLSHRGARCSCHRLANKVVIAKWEKYYLHA